MLVAAQIAPNLNPLNNIDQGAAELTAPRLFAKLVFRLLRRQSEIVERDHVTRAGSILARHCELKCIVPGRREVKVSQIEHFINSWCSGVLIFVLRRAYLRSIDGELPNASGVESFNRNLHLVNSRRGDVEGECNVVAHGGGI